MFHFLLCEFKHATNGTCDHKASPDGCIAWMHSCKALLLFRSCILLLRSLLLFCFVLAPRLFENHCQQRLFIARGTALAFAFFAPCALHLQHSLVKLFNEPRLLLFHSPLFLQPLLLFFFLLLFAFFQGLAAKMEQIPRQ